MMEYELRFRAGRDMSEDIAKLGFEKKAGFSMSDIVFETKDWVPGTPLCPASLTGNEPR